MSQASLLAKTDIGSAHISFLVQIPLTPSKKRSSIDSINWP